ncbi:uncharacterized protein LOC113278893 [Papaver somniferum]|uniref:uncharacterized protein LOC113278893 n=1 Tax=Papaver somniferum TaxID=3469 RepID=UPI000E6F8E36|nr:uncharacterized protein LOC113278893 [Papaver somniferum]
MNDSCSSVDSAFRRKVWGIDCLPKIKFFLWKIFTHMLPVNSLLHIYNPNVDVTCPLCHSHEETVMHLFINCHVVSHIWFGLSLQHLTLIDLEWIDDIFLYWHDSALGISPFKVSWPSVGVVVMWCVWKLRCDVLFRNVSIDLERVIMDIKRMISSYITPQLRSSGISRDVKIPISEVDHFMFVDGSYKDFKMGVGVIWCDVAGNVRSSRSDFGLIPDVVGAEVSALILAISWAEEMNLPKVVFVSDCLQLVNFVNGDSSNVEWRSVDLLEHCQSLLSSSLSFKIMYIKQEGQLECCL